MTAQTTPGHGAPADEADAHTLTGRARRWLLRKLPPDKLLPEDQPSYVASWAYVFGMGAIASLLWIIVSGIVLGLNGPQWYHVSSLGSFVNSTHLWSVELFFIFMVVHLWLKFWMAAWRGGRALTWITGVISFVVSIVAAFTGYLLQTNFDSQWIAFEAKDALNAVGVGAATLLPQAWMTWLNTPHVLSAGPFAVHWPSFELFAGWLGLTCYSTAFIAEEFRAGVRGVGIAQYQAGAALGMTRYATLRHVVVPQAVRIATPPLAGQYMNIVKNSSLTMAIGVAELSYMSRQVDTESFRTFQAFGTATALYIGTIALIEAALVIWQHTGARALQRGRA